MYNPRAPPTPNAHHDIPTVEKIFNLIFNPPSNSKISKPEKEEQKSKVPLT